MKPHEQWAESEAGQKRKRSETLASKTPPCRVAWLHKWRNVSTGKTCEQTTAEFSQSKKISQAEVAKMIRFRTRSEKGWTHQCKIKRVIQGNPVEWIAMRKVKNGSKSLQRKETVRSAYNFSILILARYAAGEGIKTIAKSLGLQPRSVWLVLLETGINTGARRNYQRDELKALEGPRRAYQKIKTDSGLLLKKRVMGRIWSAMRNQNVNANGSFSLVGCTPEELKQHLASKFAPGMGFENYGEWHVDHIKPCASFDLSDPQQARECFNWKNLQPLWARDNLSKSDNYARAEA